MQNPEHSGEESIGLVQEMERSYLDYAMSVIVSRALPDLRDGLKPVHRRILYTMHEGGYMADKPFRKSARVVGEVMGKYHPHGDQAIYDAMARLTQDFSMRLPLIQGQGNFGSMDGDPPAAMRYTEARLNAVSQSMLDDIDKQTIDFRPNYDESDLEPEVLPIAFPNLLVNGAGGIAVGMATNIPPHNLGEVIAATVAILRNPEILDEELLEIIPAPDFPTGGVIHGVSGAREGLLRGRGSVVLRAKVEINRHEDKPVRLIVREIPYQVNKSRLIERIAEVVRNKIVEGIADLRDESDRHGVRIVIELKRDTVAEVVLAQLFKNTQLQNSFGVNMLALNRGRPERLSLRQVLQYFLTFREQVVIRRAAFLVRKARARAHVIVALLVALQHVEEMVVLIKASEDAAEARANLRARQWPIMGDILFGYSDESLINGVYHLSEIQARAILDLRLQALTGLEKYKLEAEIQGLIGDITGYLAVLGKTDIRHEMMIEEFKTLAEKFSTPRRTQIEMNEVCDDIESLIQREEMVVTVTRGGYVKRVPLSVYRAQRRGGKGRSGMSTRDDDVVVQLFVVSTHAPVLFFSSLGLVYRLKIFELPQGLLTSRGKALVNLLPLSPGEIITAILPLPEDVAVWDQHDIVFITAKGNVRRNRLSDFALIRANGKIAMKLDEGDHLISVRLYAGHQDFFLATAEGRAIRFAVSNTNTRGNETGVRIFAGRNSTGVRGVRLADQDSVVSATLLGSDGHDPETRRQYLQAHNAWRRHQNRALEERQSEDGLKDAERQSILAQSPYAEMQSREQMILSVSSNGMGQLASIYDYRVANRGGRGVDNMELINGANIIDSLVVDPRQDQLMLITQGGKVIRIHTADLRRTSRNSRGVRLFDIAVDDRVVSVARLVVEDEDADDVPDATEAPDTEETLQTED
ncbi:MAG: DNA gyrase subunit A [Alphaproteobacteria bacterium]|nr:DNA gyrase subunit A [Alphaproteobacteria bacterium]